MRPQTSRPIPQPDSAGPDRFVAFAFAAAELLIEIEGNGRIAYATGAFRSRLGMPPDQVVGQHLRTLLDPAEHDGLDQMLLLLEAHGRLLPCTVRLAGAEGATMVLAGLRLDASRGRSRMCLTLTLPPGPVDRSPQPRTPARLVRDIERKLQDGEACSLGLLEVAGADAARASRRIAASLSGAIATEIGPGRFGVLKSGMGQAELAEQAAAAKALMGARRGAVHVASQLLDCDAQGLTPRQVTAALRRAIDVFGQDGLAGLSEAGFRAGLAGYMTEAMQHTARLRQAIADGRFDLAFQPVVDLERRATHHVEALVRPKPIRGLPTMRPQAFVLLAETLGLTVELDLAIARAAADAALRGAVPVAFNLSAQSMQDPAFHPRLLALLDGHAAQRAGKLSIEMTETAQLDDLTEPTRLVKALRALDIPFCLDDFGAGWMDIRVLRAMEADCVKLDGSYVPDVLAAGRERAFVTGLIDIAHSVGASVVAEWVSTEEQAAALRAARVEYGQGWLFGRPGPLPTLPRPRAAARTVKREEWA